MQEEILPFGNFAARLSALVATRGLPQKDIALKAGITPAALSRYMSGKRFPKYAEARRLAAVFDMPIELFMQSDAATLSTEDAESFREDPKEYQIDWMKRAHHAEEKITRLKAALITLQSSLNRLIKTELEL
jgi:transcriptional regulator with XRE-family HTH domain